MAVISNIAGPIIGLIFGVVLFWAGVGPAFAVLGLMLAGWLIGKVVNGDWDLLGFLYNRTRQTQESRRMDTLMRR